MSRQVLAILMIFGVLTGMALLRPGGVLRPSPVEGATTHVDPATCRAAEAASKEKAVPSDPLGHPMARHLNKAHHLRVAATEPADLLIAPAEAGQVRVAFQPDLLARLPKGALAALELDEPDSVLSEGRYARLLMMLHAYLTIHPPKPAGGENTNRKE